jgi:hypothetical protein
MLVAEVHRTAVQHNESIWQLLAISIAVALIVNVGQV